MDNLFETMANISKAYGYDIVSKQAGQLQDALNEIEAKIKHPDIEAIRYKAIHMEFDALLNEIQKIITQSKIPKQ